MENHSFTYKSFEIIPLSNFNEVMDIIEDFVFDDNKDLAKEVICTICQNIVYDPCSCNTCQNIFCKKCIDQWIKNSHRCPMRCNQSGFFRSQEIPKITKNIINKIKLKCIKYSEGCNEPVSYENFFKHLKSCKYIRFKCEYCEFEGSQEKSIEHSKNCAKSYRECLGCKAKYKKKEFDIFHLKDALKRMDGMKGELSNLKEENKKLNDELKNFQNEEVMRLNSIQILGDSSIEYIKEDNFYIFDLKGYNTNIKFLEKCDIFYATDEQKKCYICDLSTLEQIEITSKYKVRGNIIYFKNMKSLGYISNSDLILYDINKNTASSNYITSTVSSNNFMIYHNKNKNLIFSEKNDGNLEVSEYLCSGSYLSISWKNQVNLGNRSKVLYIKESNEFIKFYQNRVTKISELDKYRGKSTEKTLLNIIFSPKDKVVYMKHSKYIIITQLKSLIILNYETLEILKEIKNIHQHEIIHLKKGKLNQNYFFLTADESGCIKLWNSVEFFCFFEMATNLQITSIDYVKSKNFLYALDVEGVIREWNLNTKFK